MTINPAYRLYELEFALRQSECNVLISGESFKEQAYAAMLNELIPELESHSGEALRCAKLPCLRQIIYLGREAQPGMLGDDPGPTVRCGRGRDGRC